MYYVNRFNTCQAIDGYTIPVLVYSAAGGMTDVSSKRFIYSVRMVDVSVVLGMYLLYVLIVMITVFFM